MPRYEPGVCNIGRAEQRTRYRIGAAGLILAAVFMLFGGGIPATPRYLLVSGTLFIGFEGVVQGYLSFCAGFALSEMYDVSDDGTDRRSVDKPMAHKKDMQQAKKIHAYAVTGAGLLTIIYILLVI